MHRPSRRRKSQTVGTAAGVVLLVHVMAFASAVPAVFGADGEPGRASQVAGSPRRKPAQRVWVALEDAQQLVQVELRSRRVVRRIHVAGRPHNIAVGRSGLVGATLWSAERVAFKKQKWRRAINIPGAPHDVKIGARRVVVANQGAARLDLLSLRGKRRGRVPLAANPHDLALSLNGRRAWVTLEGSDDIAIVNLKKKRVVRYLSTGRSPHDILFSPDRRVWVTDWNGAVHVYSRRGKLLKSRALGDEAHHLAFTPDGRQVWIQTTAPTGCLFCLLEIIEFARVSRSAGLRITSRSRPTARRLQWPTTTVD